MECQPAPSPTVDASSCIRLRLLYKDHVWSYDFVADRTHDGRPIRMLTVLDEHSRECLAIKVARSLKTERSCPQFRLGGRRSDRVTPYP